MCVLDGYYSTQLLQQHINRSQRRIARMKGVAPPSKRELEQNLAKRLYIPEGGRPGAGRPLKRFNRVGTKGSVSLVEEDEDESAELKPFAKAGKANKAAKKGKGKAGTAAGAAGAAGASGAAGANGSASGSSGAASAASGLTPAIPPTANNSLGLAIECVAELLRADIV